MSILFSGDFHANAVGELDLITKSALIEKFQREKYKKIKYHIILGDGGFQWPGNSKIDLINYKTLALRPFPILCVIGNHEPILGMTDVQEVDLGIGETVLQIQTTPLVAYLKRGKVYTIEGLKILVLGGALSIDKRFRRPGISWWENEYWSEQEKHDVFKLLETENSFDLVISHTGPHHVNIKLFGRNPNFFPKFTDDVALMNDEIHGRIQFREWWCGHWHKDEFLFDPKLNQGYQFLYRTTKILEKLESGIQVYNEFGDDR